MKAIVDTAILDSSSISVGTLSNDAESETEIPVPSKIKVPPLDWAGTNAVKSAILRPDSPEVEFTEAV